MYISLLLRELSIRGTLCVRDSPLEISSHPSPCSCACNCELCVCVCVCILCKNPTSDFMVFAVAVATDGRV